MSSPFSALVSEVEALATRSFQWWRLWLSISRKQLTRRSDEAVVEGNLREQGTEVSIVIIHRGLARSARLIPPVETNKLRARTSTSEPSTRHGTESKASTRPAVPQIHGKGLQPCT